MPLHHHHIHHKPHAKVKVVPSPRVSAPSSENGSHGGTNGPSESKRQSKRLPAQQEAADPQTSKTGTVGNVAVPPEQQPDGSTNAQGKPARESKRQPPPADLKVAAAALAVAEKEGPEALLCINHATTMDLALLSGDPEPPLAPYIVGPSGPMRVAWDVTMLALLAYVALVTPVRIGFEAQPVAWSFGWWVEGLVDTFFIADVCLNFFTACCPFARHPVSLNDGANV